jgi:glycosyltransferase involved in cell wall biosynthesis
MRVLLDFTQIPTNRTGVGVYAENLVRELRYRFLGEDLLLVLIQKDEQKIRELVREYPNVIVASLPFGLLRNRLTLLLFEQFVMPIFLIWKKIDLVHSLHYTHPLFSFCPRVVTIHDLTFLLSPELHTRSRTLVMPFFIKHAVRYAEALIFVSNATSLDSDRLIPSKRGNLRTVIPLGVDLAGFDMDEQSQEKALEKFSIARPFILFLGTIEPRKNILRLIQAFEQIAGQYPNLLLVLAGKPGWDFDGVFDAIKASEYRKRIRHLGFVTESEKRALLVNCEVLVYPSLYEGFGLPVLEAMAAGAPVITSNVSSLPEVAGNAALLINPLSVEEIADAIRAVVNNNDKKDVLRTLGKRRAADFSWANMAKRTYDLYRLVAKK